MSFWAKSRHAVPGRLAQTLNDSFPECSTAAVGRSESVVVGVPRCCVGLVLEVSDRPRAAGDCYVSLAGRWRSSMLKQWPACGFASAQGSPILNGGHKRIYRCTAIRSYGCCGASTGARRHRPRSNWGSGSSWLLLMND